MKKQNYANHRRVVPGFHMALSLLLIMGTVAATVNIFRHLPNKGGFVSAVLILVIFVSCLLLFWYARQFPIRAQDRALRAEENLRYYVLTGKLLNNRLTMGQVIALRFAPDEELVALVDKAIAESMSPDDIKKSIKDWREDHHRA